MSKSVLITGASSGIGRALAYEFSRRGYALGLCARRIDLLEVLKEELSRETKVSISKLDVSDFKRVQEVLNRLADEVSGVKVIIANAGVSEKSFPGNGTFNLDRKVLEINLLGAIATIDSGVNILKKEGGGQIVGVSSIAGLRGLSTNPTYSASKAALSTYIEGIRNHLKDHNIGATNLNLGFIDTKINSHLKFRPFVISPEKGAGIMVDLIEENVWSSSVPRWPWSLISYIMQKFPNSLWHRINI